MSLCVVVDVMAGGGWGVGWKDEMEHLCDLMMMMLRDGHSDYALVVR